MFCPSFPLQWEQIEEEELLATTLKRIDTEEGSDDESVDDNE